MPVRDILLLGDPRLHQTCRAYLQDDLPRIKEVVTDLKDTMNAFRSRNGFGRAIAAPQIGELGRLVFLQVDRPVTLINPVLSKASDEMMTLWDDCMSFPGLLVRVHRHQTCTVTFRDLDWQEQSWPLDGDLAELLQHECDHLDGILATQRAIDSRSFALAAGRPHLK